MNLADENRLKKLERVSNEHAARLLAIEALLAKLAEDEEEEQPETDLEGNLVPKPEQDADPYAGLG